MNEPSVSKKQLVLTSYLQREDIRYHHSYEEELLQFIYIMNGDMRSVEESRRLFTNNSTGILSKDTLRNYKYLFVASTTLATRYAIRGGMESQDAYNMSDLFIQRMDLCKSVAEVCELQTEMIRAFTEQVAEIKSSSSRLSSQNLYIKKVEEYIYLHLHEKIIIDAIANDIGLSPNYLSTLFKKETGLTLQQYITKKKIEVASGMLLYSEYTPTDIGNILAFSSTSHFIKTFKSITGLTPRQYKMHIQERDITKA